MTNREKHVEAMDKWADKLKAEARNHEKEDRRGNKLSAAVAGILFAVFVIAVMIIT